MVWTTFKSDVYKLYQPRATESIWTTTRWWVRGTAWCLSVCRSRSPGPRPTRHVATSSFTVATPKPSSFAPPTSASSKQVSICSHSSCCSNIAYLSQGPDLLNVFRQCYDCLTILPLSFDNAKITIDVRRTSNWLNKYLSYSYSKSYGFTLSFLLYFCIPCTGTHYSWFIFCFLSSYKSLIALFV